MRRLIFPLALFLLPAFPAIGSEIRVSAAVSLTEAVREMAAGFTRKHPEMVFVLNFGGSGILAKQIDNGAPVDIYIAANLQWMNFLVEEDRILAATVADLGENALVFIGDRDLKIGSLADVAELRRIAIGSPKGVPAGRYAAEALKKAGVYDQLAAERRLVLAQDVRQALIYVERGEVDGAFVYRTDARLARNSVILLEIPPSCHSPITYPAGMTPEGAKNPAAVSFFEYLQGPEAKRILRNHAFP